MDHGYFDPMLFYMQHMPLSPLCVHHSSSQEVITRSPSVCRDMPLIVRNGRENAKPRVQVLIHSHDRSNITTAVAVVRCRPDSHYRVLWEMILMIVSITLVET